MYILAFKSLIAVRDSTIFDGRDCKWRLPLSFDARGLSALSFIIGSLKRLKM